LFVKELLKEIRTPDLMAEETLNRTRVGVTRASRQEQVPWISSSLAEDFSFIPSGSGPRPTGSSTPVATAPATPPVPAPAPAPAPPPPVAAPASPPPPPPAVSKPAEGVIPPPAPPAKPLETPSPALADDPTIKSLNDKLKDNPDDAAALYRRGQVYASKGIYELA